jgi:hypothetical protein
MRGRVDHGWHALSWGQPPRRGDLIVMELPDGAEVPPGYSRIPGGCWKRADGSDSTVFPYPTAWYSGVDDVVGWAGTRSRGLCVGCDTWQPCGDDGRPEPHGCRPPQ